MISRSHTVTIASGESLSGVISLGVGVPVRIIMPGTWTTAALTFQVSADGVTFVDKYDGIGAGAEFTVAAAASRGIDLNPADWLGCPFIKMRSGTSGTPVNQGAARTIVLVKREVA